MHSDIDVRHGHTHTCRDWYHTFSIGEDVVYIYCNAKLNNIIQTGLNVL